MSADEQNAGADARGYVDHLLARGVRAGASDVHIEPAGGGKVEVKFRVDGMLERVEMLPEDAGRSAVLRLMVMAQLLTYKLDIPQEGRMRVTMGELAGAGFATAQADGASTGRDMTLDLRLAVIPAAHGIRAVVRLPAELTMPRELEALGLPEACVEALKRFARGDTGMMLVTGPAGSGKTTTIYALLSHLAKVAAGISIISLEDPIERIIAGVTQIEVAPHGQLTYERALKSILRQDPQVLVLGEIRDAATASLAVQAALSGHRLIATLHAGDPAGAVARLLEMGLEPYQVSSSLYGVLSQRLVRKLAKTRQGEEEKRRKGNELLSSSPLLPVSSSAWAYKGRTVVAEFGALDDGLRRQIAGRADAGTLRDIFHRQAGHATLRHAANALVQAGITDSEEVARVLGD